MFPGAYWQYWIDKIQLPAFSGLRPDHIRNITQDPAAGLA